MLTIDGYSNINEVNYIFNDVIHSVEEVDYNTVFVWPITSGVWYKYKFLENIHKGSINENSYELYLSNRKLDDDYIYSPEANAAPKWQSAQQNVVGPNGEPYASPMSFVRRVIIKNPITPIYINHWFDHLYGGLNTFQWMMDEYPFEWVNFQGLKLIQVRSLEGAFMRCHAPVLDLSTWLTSLIVNTKDMFKCSSAKHIYINPLKWDMSNVVDSKHMFHEAYYLPNFESGLTDKSKAKLVSEGGYLEEYKILVDRRQIW